MMGWLGRAASRQVLSIGAVMAALSSALILAGLGQVSPPLDSRHLTDPTVWVPTSSLGLVHPIDATVGRAGPALALDGGKDAELTTVQAGSNAYVVNQTEGTVRFIDASVRQFGVAWEEPEREDPDGRLSVFAGSGVTWAYSSASHLLHRLDPGPQPLEVAQPIPLVADGADAVLRHGTNLVVPDEADGEVVEVSPDGQTLSASVAPAGHDLVVRMVDDTVVVVDRDDRVLITLDSDLQPVNRCKLDVTDAPAPAEGEGSDGRLALVVPAQNILVVADVRTCLVVSAIVNGDLGVPVVVGPQVFVPEYGQGRVHIADLGGSLDQIPVIESEALGVTGRFDLVADDGMVVFNDPASSAAGAVFADGTVAGPGKFNLADGGRTVPGINPSPGTEGPGGGSPTGTGTENPKTGPGTVSPGPKQKDPAEPGTSPSDPSGPKTDPSPTPVPTPTPPGPQDPSLPTLQCTADRPSVPVNQDVTFTTQVIGGQPGQVASFEFVVGPEVVPDPDGILVRPFPASGQVTVTVRGVLAGGGTTATAGCGTIAVGDAPLPATLLCRSDTGQAAQVDQPVTFSATGLAGTTWEWTFSDGQTSREVSPQHRFSQPGPASATIVATSGTAGRQESTCPLQITEGVPPLTPSFDYQPKPVVANQPVRFVSTTPNAAGVASYSWTFTGASPATATGAEVTGVTWADAGSKSVELVVTNTAGQSYRVSSSVNVQSAPTAYQPVAVSVKALPNTVTNTTISLEMITDAGQATSAQWTVDRVDDSGVPATVARFNTLSATYTIPEHDGGVYTVKVVATDSRGATDTASVSFNAVRPLNPAITVDKSPIVKGDPVTFTGSSTNTNVTTWEWDFGDGSTGQGKVVTHTYSSTGDKRVTLKVSLKGASTPVSKTFNVADGGTVGPVPPVTDLSLSAATTTLTGAGLTVGTTTRGCQPGVPLDQVYAQDPSAGTQVVKPSAVNLSVSDGTSWVMPDIALGQTAADLGLSGKLTITTTDKPTTDPAQIDKKIGQSVPAGTSHCGTVSVEITRGLGGPVTPSLSCDAKVTYPAPVSCTASGNPSGGTVDWGDGSGPQPIGSGGSLTHNYHLVGSVTPRLTHGGVTVSAGSVSVTFKVTITCSGTGPDQTIWKLDASGAYVRPLDQDGNPILTERVSDGTAQKTGLCKAESPALTDLGGSVAWTATAKGQSRNGTGDFAGEQLGGWLGVQPGTVSMTVTVSTISQLASADIYLAGCG